jgi:threonyl-tRNA synthetase
MSEQDAAPSIGEQYIPKGYDPDLYRIRHSLAHVMAQAVVERFPETRLAIGPPIRDRFYYDFELPRELTEEDLKAIEDRMREIIRGKHRFTYREVSPDEARELFRDQPYKLELIEGLLQGGRDEYGNPLPDAQKPVLTIFTQDTFTDLCRGPHVPTTGNLNPKAFKLLTTAGAYWRGDERNKMLTRIYGTGWRTPEELKAYLELVEKAERIDHRRLGKELELFTNSDLLGPGLPLWLPKGSVIRRELERFIVDLEIRWGYEHVYSPHLAKVDLYQTSGHWEHYKDSMFPVMELEHEKLVLRPMNCPHHIQIYASRQRSYRELPIRIAELGTMYRYEKSGVVTGLSRVRSMTLNDAHIFCRPEQIKEEFSGVMRLIEHCYKVLGIKNYRYRLSLRDPKNTEKFVQNDTMWNMAENILREAMRELGLPFEEAPGEAAFYGPKIDIQFADLLGREETISTVQIDFHLPNQFQLVYTGEDNTEHRPVMIHRGVISTMERMTAYLIELYEGAFPVWLAPVQVVVVPIADRHLEYARRVEAQLLDKNFRVELDASDRRMNAKIRAAQVQKIPFVLVIGDREAETGAVAVRLRDGKDLGAMPVFAFEAQLEQLVKTKALEASMQPQG